MSIGRGWYGAIYSVFFVAWGIVNIVTHSSNFGLVLGVLTLVVGVAAGIAWWYDWRQARSSPPDDGRGGR